MKKSSLIKENAPIVLGYSSAIMASYKIGEKAEDAAAKRLATSYETLSFAERIKKRQINKRIVGVFSTIASSLLLAKFAPKITSNRDAIVAIRAGALSGAALRTYTGIMELRKLQKTGEALEGIVEFFTPKKEEPPKEITSQEDSAPNMQEPQEEKGFFDTLLGRK